MGHLLTIHRDSHCHSRMGVGVSVIMLLRGHLSLSENHFSRSERLFSRDHGQKSIELETVVKIHWYITIILTSTASHLSSVVRPCRQKTGNIKHPSLLKQQAATLSCIVIHISLSMISNPMAKFFDKITDDDKVKTIVDEGRRKCMSMLNMATLIMRHKCHD